LITAAPGTPENPSSGPIQWNKTLPAPPWAYEYAYPADCLRACFVVPQYMTGFASGVPITAAVTGGAPSFWNGPPARFRVAIDQPVTITSAVPVAAGIGYSVGQNVVLAGGVGVAGQLTVTSVNVNGGITGVSVFVSGSYSTSPINPVPEASGAGATFNLTLSSAVDQKVLLTNQEFAILAYVRSAVATEPAIWDSQFTQAVIQRLGARLVYALTGDKALANERTKYANEIIIAARNTDGNEGLTVNDVTPDWIRSRGISYPTDFGWSPNMGFDWGQLLTIY